MRIVIACRLCAATAWGYTVCRTIMTMVCSANVMRAAGAYACDWVLRVTFTVLNCSLIAAPSSG